VVEPERARTLVMAMILGNGGVDLIQQFAAQAAGGPAVRTAYWGQLITTNLPSAAMGPIADRVKKAFLRRFAASQSATVVGRAIPFGVGAAIGGTGNHLLGRKVISSARSAFGPAPETFPTGLEVEVKVAKSSRRQKGVKEPKPPRSVRRQLKRMPALPPTTGATPALPASAPSSVSVISAPEPPDDDER